MSVTFSADTRTLPAAVAEAAPEANFTNTNAVGVITLLGLRCAPEEGLVGTVPPAELPGLRQRIITLLNVDGALRPAVRASAVIDEPGLPRVYSCGTDEEAVALRLAALEHVVLFAQLHGVGLCWG